MVDQNRNKPNPKSLKYKATTKKNSNTTTTESLLVFFLQLVSDCSVRAMALFTSFYLLEDIQLCFNWSSNSSQWFEDIPHLGNCELCQLLANWLKLPISPLYLMEDRQCQQTNDYPARVNWSAVFQSVVISRNMAWG